MFDYEMHQLRAAELIREADDRRLIRQVRKARKEAARSAATGRGAGGIAPWPVHEGGVTGGVRRWPPAPTS